MNYLGLEITGSKPAKSTHETLKFVFKIYFFLTEFTERK